MKKIMTAILLIALVFALTACEVVSGIETEEETPSQALINIMTALKEVNQDELARYGVAELIGNNDKLSSARNKKIFEAFEFTVLSVEEDEDSAKASIEIKTKDLATAGQNYANESVNLTAENNKLGDNKLDNAAMRNKYNDLFIEIIDRSEYTEFKEVVDVYLTKEGNSWKADLDSKFHNAIYGNLATAQSQITWPGADNKITVQEDSQEAPVVIRKIRMITN